MDIPEYEKHGHSMLLRRKKHAIALAEQIRQTVSPYLDIPFNECRVLDVGCGYGFTAIELARQTREVVGVDPSHDLIEEAQREKAKTHLPHLRFLVADVAELSSAEIFDLIVLDNVLEHVHQQFELLKNIATRLAPGGVLFLVCPNKLWPLEVHYHLPFLSYLPLPLANRYLKLTGRGTDYTDASYAPTYGQLVRLLAQFPELEVSFTLPADVSLTITGSSPLVRTGIRLLKNHPALWRISKAFLVVAKRRT